MAHHPRHHYRLAAGLAEAGYDVVMLSQPDPGGGHADAVPIRHLPRRRSRLARMLSGPATMWRAVRLRPDCLYVVSLDLLPWAVAARALTRRRAVFDSNEQYDEDMLDKEYLPGWARPALSRVVRAAEPWLAGRLDAATVAVPATLEKFCAAGVRTVLVRNFPRARAGAPARDPEPDVDVLVGGTLSPDLIAILARTAEALAARAPSPPRWLVAVRGADAAERALLEEKLGRAGVRDQVDLRYDVPFTEMPGLMARSRVGFVFYQGVAAPQRMFEYMAAGLPFVACDLPWTGDYLRDAGVADLAPPEPEAYADALARLLADPGRREAMSRRGPGLARERYSWEGEAEGLTRLFGEVLGTGGPAG
jgi:glycosyltransferase involved in cell wall biosynthesis